MKELHIHEVLRMMVETSKTYSNKEEFVKDITEIYGAETQFFACSNSGMDANTAFDFLVSKGKINLNSQNNIGIASDMTMCDDEHHH